MPPLTLGLADPVAWCQVPEVLYIYAMKYILSLQCMVVSINAGPRLTCHQTIQCVEHIIEACTILTAPDSEVWKHYSGLPVLPHAKLALVRITTLHTVLTVGV